MDGLHWSKVLDESRTGSGSSAVLGGRMLRDLDKEDVHSGISNHEIVAGELISYHNFALLFMEFAMRLNIVITQLLFALDRIDD